MRKIYFDMDGVLADFEGQPNAIDRFITEDGFFLKLKPTCLASVLNQMLQDPMKREQIYILSASPNKRADIHKTFWLWEHVPLLLDDHIKFIRGGTNEKKSDHLNKGDILIDDYSNNLIDWEEKGGKGIKLLNGRNGSGQKWKGDTLTLDVLLAK